MTSTDLMGWMSCLKRVSHPFFWPCEPNFCSFLCDNSNVIVLPSDMAGLIIFKIQVFQESKCNKYKDKIREKDGITTVVLDYNHTLNVLLISAQIHQERFTELRKSLLDFFSYI